MTNYPSSRFRAALSLVTIAASVALVAGCAASPAVSAPSSDSSSSSDSPKASSFADVPLVPEKGVYLGVYYGDGTPSDTDAAIGRAPQIHLTYFGWEDPWATDASLTEDRARGQISLVNWEPFGAAFEDIVAGRYDDMLAQRGSEASKLAAPVFVDFAAEMNEEEGWGGHDPELYIAAYRHVHDVVSRAAGDKVVWVWAPNNVDSEGAPAALDYYPGDDVVDWTGIDGYNWGTAQEGFDWQSVESVFADVYDDLDTLGKPIIIGETASAEDGGSKAAWIDSIAPTLRDRFPNIRALVWFDVDKERDWRFRSSDASLAAFRDLAVDPIFQTGE